MQANSSFIPSLINLSTTELESHLFPISSTLTFKPTSIHHSTHLSLSLSLSLFHHINNMSNFSSLVLVLGLCLPLLCTASRSLKQTAFIVEGRVFCDTCRAGFETPATDYISGAKVKVECRQRKSEELTFTAEGITDSTGTYHITVMNDHEKDICEAMLVESSDTICSNMLLGRERAPVVLTFNDGIPSYVRFANNMGYMMSRAMSGCEEVMKMYQLDEEDI